jgi:tetratricopeptide (TPR) repeat protein
MEVGSRALRQFVVRISSVDGPVLGSGFFVAPGWVLTCAHVVRDTAVVAAGGARWEVAARSAPPTGASALWPFPDLALLRAASEADHLCAPLYPGDPAGGVECYSWGYARREQGVDPAGSPASFGFEGVEADGFLRLKAGQASPGLSGAPLVCPVRRAVVGIITATRDAGSDLGGWAAPASALTALGVPEDLWTRNRAAAVRSRRDWNAVLPTDSGDALAQPWETFVKGPRSSPASLLRADFGVVPYLFRDRELGEAVAWCEEADAATPMAVAQGAAPGGAGKTRFAIELCKRLIPLGWVAGLWRGEEKITRVPLPRLVVIDYAEDAEPASLTSTLDALRRHATAMAPVRVLLLSRTRAGRTRDPLDALLESAPATLIRVLDASQENTVAATRLSVPQRQELYGKSAGYFARAWQAEGAGSSPDLSADRYGLALEVMFEALDRVLGGPDPAGAGDPPAMRALAHEARYWRATAPRPLPDDELLQQCAALATLAGAGSRAEADTLLSIVPLTDPKKIISWLGSLYDGPGTLNPLRPDRLGEALVAQALRDREDLLGKILSIGSDDQLTRCFDVLARLSVYDNVAKHATAAALAPHRKNLALRAEAQSRGRPGRPGRLALASSLTRLITAIPDTFLAQDAIRSGNTTHQRDPAIFYTRLADLARDTGQGDQARKLYQRALAICQDLADADPGNPTCQRDLAVSHNRLGDLARDTGQGDQARELYEHALAVTEALAAACPGNTFYQHDLSISYDRLARLAHDVGQADSARELYQRALALDEKLAAAHPDNTRYQHGLSVSYERLGDLARDAGDTHQARDLNLRALAIRQTLADGEPGNATYRRDLANSYERLGDLAQDTGDTSQARDLHQHALAIRQDLTTTQPGNNTYRRDLANSYERLGELAESTGDISQARDLYERARAVLEALAESEPSPRYQRDLATTYERLGEMAMRAGHTDDAIRWVSRAVALRRELHGNEPQRLDLSEELASTLYLAAITGARPDAACKSETAGMVEAFERQGFLTERAHQLLAWARGSAIHPERRGVLPSGRTACEEEKGHSGSPR